MPPETVMPAETMDVTTPPTSEPTQTPEVGGVVLSSGRILDPEQKAVALTFDDGPSKFTSEIMDALEAYDGRGTFFVVGERLDEWSDTLKAENDRGHQIGSHTYSHPNLTKLSEKHIREQFDETQALVLKYVGEEPAILRPPYGSINELVKATIPVPMIKWSVDSRDWDSRDAASVYDVITSSVVDGDIILMHDLYDSTAEAVRRVAPWLHEQGFQMCTVEELFELKHINLHPGSAWLSAKGTPDY